MNDSRWTRREPLEYEWHHYTGKTIVHPYRETSSEFARATVPLRKTFDSLRLFWPAKTSGKHCDSVFHVAARSYLRWRRGKLATIVGDAVRNTTRSYGVRTISVDDANRRVRKETRADYFGKWRVKGRWSSRRTFHHVEHYWSLPE